MTTSAPASASRTAGESVTSRSARVRPTASAPAARSTSWPSMPPAPTTWIVTPGTLRKGDGRAVPVPVPVARPSGRDRHDRARRPCDLEDGPAAAHDHAPAPDPEAHDAAARARRAVAKIYVADRLRVVERHGHVARRRGDLPNRDPA